VRLSKEEKYMSMLHVLQAHCWPFAFREWLESKRDRYPTRKFHEQVGKFLKEPENLPLASSFFIDDSGKVKAISVKIDLAASAGKLNPADTEELQAQYDGFLQEIKNEMDAFQGAVWHTSRLWVQKDLEAQIVQSFGSSVALGIFAGFIAVEIFTWWNLMAGVSIVVVVGGVMTSVTAILSAVGWALGPLEVISIIVFLGYSMTYSIHIAHAYIEASEEVKSAQQRMRLALLRLGPATISSALTTLSTCVFLASCVSTIFVRFGIVLFVITVQGVLAALIVEPAFLSVAQGGVKSLCLKRRDPSEPGRQRSGSRDGMTSPVEEERESDVESPESGRSPEPNEEEVERTMELQPLPDVQPDN
jgi:preprotein translocase subunit SecF